MPSLETPCSEVELTISAKNLKDMDFFSKSDPMCVLWLKNHLSENEQYREIGRTECLMNTLNPEWARKFRLDYFFEQLQRVKFEIYDIDSQSQQLSAHDFLGRIELTLGEIVAAAGGRLNRKLEGLSGDCGTILVSAEETEENSKEVLWLRMKGIKLDKKDFFGKSDPFLNIYRLNDDNSKQLAFRTDVIQKTLNPEWKPFKISLRQLCANQKNRPFLIDCFDYDNDGSSHDLIGSCQTSVDDLLNKSARVFELINPKKRQKQRKYKNSGQLQVIECTLRHEHSFLDYIRAGVQLHFTVAVDFTASNGHPSDPRSLHYTCTQNAAASYSNSTRNNNNYDSSRCYNYNYNPNQYEIALQAVGNICQDYNSSKMFAAWGFGAKVPPANQVSHQFHLNLHPSDPRCPGVPGILQAYKTAIQNCTLYGPTNFSPIINQVGRMAAERQDGSEFFILLIITDGIITDMEQTKGAIVAASVLPMSIIIVGVGNEDFSAMIELDADDRPLMSAGRYAQRDIVQFVPLRDYLGANDWAMSQSHLAKEVLAEVPQQVIGWMQSRNINPNQILPKKPPEQFAASSQVGQNVVVPPQNYPQNTVPPQNYPQNTVPQNYPQNTVAPQNYPQNTVPLSELPPKYSNPSELPPKYSTTSE